MREILSGAFSRTPEFLPKLIFSSQRLEVSTLPSGAVRLDWIGALNKDELDPEETARLIQKLTDWQRESAAASSPDTDKE